MAGVGPVDHGNGRLKLWIFIIAIVIGSGMFTLIQIGNGLHESILLQQQVIGDLRLKISDLQGSNTQLVSKLQADRKKTVTLRKKSKVVTEELFGEKQKNKKTQTDLAICRVQFDSLVKNCTGKSRILGKQFNYTMSELKTHVVENKQLRALLSKNLEERTKIELQLEQLQGTVFNITQKLGGAKKKLKESALVIKQQQDDLDFLKDTGTDSGCQQYRDMYSANKNILLSEISKLGGNANQVTAMLQGPD